MGLCNIKKRITDMVKTDKLGDRLVKLLFQFIIGLVLGRIVYLLIISNMISSK